jgi:hypothetical protein
MGGSSSKLPTIVCVDEEAYLNELVAYRLHLRATSMIDSLTNLLRYLLMFLRKVHLCDQLLWLQVLGVNMLLPALKNLNPLGEEQS